MSKAENEQQYPLFDAGGMASEGLPLLEIARKLAWQALQTEHQAAELRVRAAEIL